MILNSLSDKALREIALKKNSKGCATREALVAQRILYYRHNSFADIPRKCNNDYLEHNGDLFDIYENMRDES